MGLLSVIGKLGKVASYLPIPGANYIGKAGDALSAVGGAVGKATAASGQNRLNQQTLAMQANRDNIAGTNAYENAAQQRAVMEAAARKTAINDVMRSSAVLHPNRSQFNTHAPMAYSPAMLASMTELEKRGLERIKMPDQYTADKMPTLAQYRPLPTDASGLQRATGTSKGTLESIGDWAAPGMSILDAVMRGRKRQTDDVEADD